MHIIMSTPRNWSELIELIDNFHPHVYFFSIYCSGRRNQSQWRAGLTSLRTINELVGIEKVKTELFSQLLYLLGPQRDDPLPMSTCFMGPSGVGKNTLAHSWLHLIKTWHLASDAKIIKGECSEKLRAVIVLINDKEVHWFYQLENYCASELKDIFIQRMKTGLWKIKGELSTRHFHHSSLIEGQGHIIDQIVLRCKSGWGSLHWQSTLHPWHIEASYIESMLADHLKRDDPPAYIV